MFTVHAKLLLVVAAAFILAGCSAEVSVGGGSIDAGDLEQEVSDQLAASVGETPKSVDCPEDLPTEEGAEVRCVITAEDDSEIGVTVTFIAIEDGEAVFDIEVDDEVQSP